MCDEETIGFDYDGEGYEISTKEVEQAFTEIFGEFDEIVEID